MRNILLMTAFLGALAWGTGCGDGGGGTGGAGGTGASGGGGTGGSHSTHSGGTGGTGATGGSTGGTGATGGSTGGTGGTGGSMSNLVNGCDPATAEDHTAETTAVINQVGFAYDPPCIKIKAGNKVQFVATFASHPLVGGLISGGAKQPDATSPITMTSTGTEATFEFPDTGTYGFYCDFHGLGGMMGAIFVEQ